MCVAGKERLMEAWGEGEACEKERLQAGYSVREDLYEDIIIQMFYSFLFTD